jgi:hypothetical protein
MIPDTLPPKIKELAERAQIASVTIVLLKEELRVVQQDLADKSFTEEERYMLWGHQKFLLKEINTCLAQLTVIRTQYYKKHK